MSYLAEWHKQQKALKDAERDRKKNASSFLNNYQGGEHDIKDHEQQKAIKDAERANKKKASSFLNNYQGGEHDIRDHEQQKAIKDAERANKKKASSILHNYQGGEHDIKDHEQLKAIKDADRANKKKASSILHNYQGGEHDIKDHGQQKVIKDVERENKKKATSILHNYQGGEHDIKDYERTIIEDKKQNHARENIALGSSHVSAETKNDIGQNNNLGNSRKAIIVEFLFGLIYEDFEPKPTADMCASAASAIIPHVISQWTNETKIFCQPKTPEVIGDITEDDWYDGDGSIRYKVKGKVAINVFAESSASEAADGLKKFLKRRVSFRPVSATEEDEATKEKKAEFISGDADQKWMRVRDGRLGGLGITF